MRISTTGISLESWKSQEYRFSIPFTIGGDLAPQMAMFGEQVFGTDGGWGSSAFLTALSLKLELTLLKIIIGQFFCPFELEYDIW